MKISVFFVVGILYANIAWGQKGIEGKYFRNDQPSCYLILNADGTFKYRFLRDIHWDLACGQYKLAGDSIYFVYQSDMFDPKCNSQGMNDTDTVGIILRELIDKRFRPISAHIYKNKITTYKIGNIADPETIDINTYIFRRKKE